MGGRVEVAHTIRRRHREIPVGTHRAAELDGRLVSSHYSDGAHVHPA